MSCVLIMNGTATPPPRPPPVESKDQGSGIVLEPVESCREDPSPFFTICEMRSPYVHEPMGESVRMDARFLGEGMY